DRRDALRCALQRLGIRWLADTGEYPMAALGEVERTGAPDSRGCAGNQNGTCFVFHGPALYPQDPLRNNSFVGRRISAGRQVLRSMRSVRFNLGGRTRMVANASPACGPSTPIAFQFRPMA